jgi:hypothetical protein
VSNPKDPRLFTSSCHNINTTSPTSGGRKVGIVHFRTQGHGVNFVCEDVEGIQQSLDRT